MTYRVDVGRVVCEAGAVAAWLVAGKGVGGGAVLHRKLVDEGSVQALNVSSVCNTPGHLTT